jgi:DNA-directed RNA polymerase specialized sigma24 family protein
MTAQVQTHLAVLRLEGFATKEIAVQLGISLSSVERKLRLVRSVWSDLIEATGAP